MPVYNTFQLEYGIGLEATWGTGVATGANVPVGGVIKLPLTNKPDFTSGIEIISSPKALGVPWRRTEEYYQGIKSPGVTLEIDLDVNTIAPFLYSLFNGVDEGEATTYTKVYNIYRDTGATVSIPDYAAKSAAVNTTPLLFSLIKNTGVADEGFRLVSGAVRSITISSNENEPMKASIEVIARDLETGYDATGNTFTLSTTNSTPILHQNLGFEIDTVATKLNSFSITYTNNMIPKHQANTTADAQIANQYVVGLWEVTGSASFVWSGDNATIIDKWIAGTDMLFEIFNPGTSNSDGASDTAGDFYLKSNIRLTAAPLVGEDEQTLEITFDGVDDGTNPAAYVTLADGVNYGWPT